MKSMAGGWVKQWLGASVLAVSAVALLPLSVARAQEQQSAQFDFALEKIKGGTRRLAPPRRK